MRYPDPVSLMTYHRGFSHSLFVLTGLAALLAWLIRRYWPQAPYGGRRLFLTLWLVLVTHPLLDAFTVYGTQLFWPLAPVPESWAAVFIIDPVYTVPLLAASLYAVAAGMTARARGLLATALAFSTVYLGFGLAGRVAAEHRVRDAMVAQGIEVTALRAVPMPFNTLVWRVLAKTPDDHYYEAVSGWFDRTSPEWLRLPLNPDAGANLAGSALHDRLRWFTGDWLRHDVIGDALVVTDLRMGVAGHYTFRFKMAERAPGAGWIAVVPSRWPSASGLAGAETGIGAHSGCAAAVAAASLVGPGLALGSCPCRPRTAARPSTASSSPGARPRHGASPCVAFLSSIVQGGRGNSYFY